MRKKNNVSCDGGFSLIELLVVMLIVSILSVAILANYRSGQKRYALVQAEQKLISDLRRAQNMAISGARPSGSFRGYGISVDKNHNDSYIFFGAVNSNQGNDRIDEEIEKINLPSGIEIADIASGANRLSIYFEPPAPTIYFTRVPPNSSLSQSITLQNGDDSSLRKTITVSSVGLISGD